MYNIVFLFRSDLACMYFVRLDIWYVSIYCCYQVLPGMYHVYLYHLERRDEDGEKDAHRHDRDEVDGAKSPRAPSRSVL